MDEIYTLSTYNTIRIFIIFVASVTSLMVILLIISSYPFKIIIKTIHKYPILNLEKYYFFYQKATAYRLLFNTNLTFSILTKIIGTTTTFITVYCAIDNNSYILLFSLITAICEVISLTIPTDKYSKMYVQAARKLEYVLNNADNLQEPDLIKALSHAYQEAEKIIEENFE